MNDDIDCWSFSAVNVQHQLTETATDFKGKSIPERFEEFSEPDIKPNEINLKNKACESIRNHLVGEHFDMAFWNAVCSVNVNNP